MFKASLDEKVSETVYHQWVSLVYYSFDNFVLLLPSTNFELLLKENRCLLVIVANNFVNNIFPIA